MAELHEVIEVLARAAAHSPSWNEGDADLIAEWVDDEQPWTDENKPAGPKPASKTTGGK